MRTTSINALFVLAAIAFATPEICDAQRFTQRRTPRFIRGPQAPPKLAIRHDAAKRCVIVSWDGRGVLMQCRAGDTRFTRVRHRPRGVHMAPVELDGMTYRLEGSGGGVYSENAVGYYSKSIPPGTSLLANSLDHYSNTVNILFIEPFDGFQVYKMDEGSMYEVATYDGQAKSWSNPDLALPPGTGFFVSNPTPEAWGTIFVGEVPQGILINPLPAGYSTKASITPQAISINGLNLPGEPGDMVGIFRRDEEGNGGYETSVYDGTINAWVPDYTPAIGEGFMIYKQNAQLWIREFRVF